MSRHRVSFPLNWLLEFCKSRIGHLPRTFPVKAATQTIIVGLDASPTGGGAWVSLDGGSILRYLVLKWGERDEVALGAKRGDSGSMALWETFTLLKALEVWIRLFASNSVALQVRGDALGVLRAVIAKRARSPAVNLAIAEINLILAPTHFELVAEHIWSEKNDVADALSRLHEGASFPVSCQSAVRDKAVQRSYHFLGKKFSEL